MSQLLTTSQVAVRLGLSVERFYRRRRRLEDAGFPAPCLPFHNRWSDTAVDAWIDRQPATATPATLPANDAPVNDWNAILRQRARDGVGVQ